MESDPSVADSSEDLVRRSLEWTTFTSEVRATLEEALRQMQVYSFANNSLRHSTLMKGKSTLELGEALDFIQKWSERGAELCERILRAPNLHAPYLRYVFQCGMKADEMSIMPALVNIIGGKEYYNGEMMLFAHRLKGNRYQLHYSNDQNWTDWVNDVERIARTSIEELRAAGELLE